MYYIDLHVYSHYRFSKILRPFCGSRNWWIIVVFFQSNILTITIVSQKYWDFLQPYSHDRFSKTLRTFYASRKSWIILVFLQHTPKEKLPIFLINTLLLHIPLLALTDGQNHRGTNYSWLGWVTYNSSRLILVGLGNLRFLQVKNSGNVLGWHRN